ncbi:MAG: hypothetical protein OXC82_08270, partial [Rhodobacteraceae bacterium]|nr:hypothetical protein [Paracoccaceae bacterium]
CIGGHRPASPSAFALEALPDKGKCRLGSAACVKRIRRPRRGRGRIRIGGRSEPNCSDWRIIKFSSAAG